MDLIPSFTVDHTQIVPGATPQRLALDNGQELFES